jgi:hypothetical protein
MRRPTLAWPLLAFGLIVLASAALAFTGITWAGWRPATCMPDDCFCEAVRDGPIAQPVNTFSNLAFVLVGLLIVAAPPADPRAPFARSPVYGWTYGVAVIVIGLGSLFYHASLTFAGQWFDVMGMYLLGSFMVLYNLARLRPLPGAVFAITYIVANAALGAALIAVPEVRRQLFATLVLVTIASEWWIRRQRQPRIRSGYFLAALGSFALAYGIWILDNERVLCAPESWLQGHAAWHLLSAAAAGFIFLYYRSESGTIRLEAAT